MLVAVRKELSDVAKRRRAKHRVHQRVQRHVSVAVAKQALVMRDIHAAEDQLSPLHQPVHVVARAYSKAGRKVHGSHTHILPRGELFVFLRAGSGAQMHAAPALFVQIRVVGRGVVPWPLLVRAQDAAVGKGLRRLDAAKHGAVHGLYRIAPPIDPLDRIRHGAADHAGAVFHRIVYYILNDLHAHEGARRVVDEGDVRIRVQGLQPVIRAFPPGRAAGDDRRQKRGRAKAGALLPEDGFVVRVHDEGDLIDQPASRKGVERSPKHAPSAKRIKRLIVAKPRPRALACGHHRAADLHRSTRYMPSASSLRACSFKLTTS